MHKKIYVFVLIDKFNTIIKIDDSQTKYNLGVAIGAPASTATHLGPTIEPAKISSK